MSAPSGQHASEKNSEVTVIDIDNDIDSINIDNQRITEDSNVPVIYIDKPKEVKAMNGNGKLFIVLLLF